MVPGCAVWAHRGGSRKLSSSIWFIISGRYEGSIEKSRKHVSSKTLSALGESQSLCGTGPTFRNQSDSYAFVWIYTGNARLLWSVAKIVEDFGQLSEAQISLEVQHYHCLDLTHEIDHSLCITGDERRWIEFPSGLFSYFSHILLRMKAIPHDDSPEMLFSLQSFLKCGHLLPDCLVLPGDFLHPDMPSLEIQLDFSEQTIVIERDCLDECLSFRVDSSAQLGVQLVATVYPIGNRRIGLVQGGQLLSDTEVYGVGLVVDCDQVDGCGFGGVLLAMDEEAVPAEWKQALICPAEMRDDIVIMEGAGSGRALEYRALHDDSYSKQINQNSRSGFSFGVFGDASLGGCSFDGLACALVSFLIQDALVSLDEPLSGGRESHIYCCKSALSLYGLYVVWLVWVCFVLEQIFHEFLQAFICGIVQHCIAHLHMARST